MKTRRGWTAVSRSVAVTAAALALAGTASATATANQEHGRHWHYNCRMLDTLSLPSSVGGRYAFAVGRDCRAFDGAPRAGRIFREFLIESRWRAVLCDRRPAMPAPRFYGVATLPDGVVGLACRRVK